MRFRNPKQENHWGENSLTFMVIPGKNLGVRKFTVPTFLIKTVFFIVFLVASLLFLFTFDYLQLSSKIAENKRLRGENYKLRQDMQAIKNKVDSMETTLERMRNYAKKLQILTGQGEKSFPSQPFSNEGEFIRAPAGKKRSMLDEGGGKLTPMIQENQSSNTTEAWAEKIALIETSSQELEYRLSLLQVRLYAQRALLASSPTLMPIAGSLSSSFGYRRHPYDGSYRLHAGVDIAADPGTPVRAPGDGMVIFSGFKEGYGKVIVIDHGQGVRSLFGHSSKLFVNSGVKVRRGEKIAEVGMTGRSTGPHLHYEVRKNGVPVNPSTFFSQPRF